MYDYTRQDMVEALRNAGLERGDLVLFYVSLAMLGLGEGVASQEGMNALFIECVQEVLGAEGTIFVPTYSYSLCKGEVYDSASTPGSIGPFPEYFRRLPGVVRSEDPILAVAGLGPAAEEIFTGLPPTSYGRGCVYDRLTQRNAKICTVGLRLNWATFRHYIEEVCEVPFRYRKVFTGPVLINGTRKGIDWTYSVRLWGDNAVPNGVPLAQMAVEDGIATSATLGRNTIFCIDAAAYVAFTSDKLRENPWLSAAGPADDPIALEERRVPVVSYGLPRDAQASLATLATSIAPLPRIIMSDAYNESLNVLANRFGLSTHQYRSGVEGVDCIVPEKWTCHEASLTDSVGNTIFDLSQSPFRIATYSASYSGDIEGSALHGRCIVSKTIAPASVMKSRSWQWCCTPDELAALTDAVYHAHIRADFSLGNLLVGERFVRGTTEESVVLLTFLDTPCQFDEGLSGVLAGCLVMEKLGRTTPLRHSVRLLVLPREFGLSVWGAKNPEALALTSRFVLLDRCARGNVAVSHAVSDAYSREEDLIKAWNRTLSSITGTVPYPEAGAVGETVDENGLLNLEQAATFVLSVLDTFE